MSYQTIWPKWIIITFKNCYCCCDKQVDFNILPYIILLLEASVVGSILRQTSYTYLSTARHSFKQNVFYAIALFLK